VSVLATRFPDANVVVHKGWACVQREGQERPTACGKAIPGGPLFVSTQGTRNFAVVVGESARGFSIGTGHPLNELGK
jgi:hypothetical protein